MIKVCLAEWYNIKTKNDGYELDGIHTEKCYFGSASKQECIDYAAKHNMQIVYQA